MLSFVFFSHPPADRPHPLGRPHLFGPDDIPVPASIESNGRIIRCARTAGDGSAGLAVQVAIPAVPKPGVPDLGTLLVQTCLLPPRDRPYLLALELARHRIMLFLNKLEDWGLADLPPSNPIMQRFEQARECFTAALVSARTGEPEHGGFTPEAEASAFESLARAIDAGERLALHAADRDLRRRMSGELYAEAVKAYTAAHGETPPADAPIVLQNSVGVTLSGRAAIGCTVPLTAGTAPVQRAVAETSELVHVPMRWTDMEPNEGEYNFKFTDGWIEWAVRRAKLPIAAGPVVDFSKDAMPDWLYIWENDYETLRELVYEHVKAVVTRYRRTVSVWTVVSGLHINDNLTLSFEQIRDLTRLCVSLVKRLHPNATVLLGIDQPWGEYFGHFRQSVPPLIYADSIAQSGVYADGYAIRLQLGTGGQGKSSRDLMSLSAMLDRYAVLERPVVVTAAACPSQQPVDGGPDPAGTWRGPWTPESQADWLSAAFSIAMAKPFVHSVSWHQLLDEAPATDGSQPPQTGLMSHEGAEKPSLRRLIHLRNSMRSGEIAAGEPLNQQPTT
ncbi:MAG: endo-1,4-beta-xylanase [Planctomycetota bacterium]